MAIEATFELPAGHWLAKGSEIVVGHEFRVPFDGNDWSRAEDRAPTPEAIYEVRNAPETVKVTTDLLRRLIIDSDQLTAICSSIGDASKVTSDERAALREAIDKAEEPF